ncbi:MAG: ABC transporter ATP-binding protein, partial [Myxococcales bacterium]|nr:ABC transporter ATP-binding protein [Myxococcales bacterium]
MSGVAAPVVELEHVSKWYGRVTALSDVSLRLAPGIWGLLGPNGAGKTTLLRLLAGQLAPNLGAVRVLGESPRRSARARVEIGLCPEADALYDELTALELVAAMAELSGATKAEARARAASALESFGLQDAMDRRVGGYSRGMRQRVKLAQAVVHDPRVLLLDEPLTGTDPVSRKHILDALRARACEGALILLSTHVLHEVESLTDQVLLIAGGRLVAEGRAAEIRALLESHPHHIVVECDRPRVLAARMLACPGVAGVRLPDPHTLVVEARDPDAAYDALATAAVEAELEVRSITSPDASLEALFHYVVERASAGAGTGADRAVGRARALSRAS